MSTHYVVVTKRENQDTELDWDENFEWHIDCVGECNGWIECGKEHKLNGIEASQDDGCPRCQFLCDNEIYIPDPRWEEGHEPWCGKEEFEFHGELHTYKSPTGWVLPYQGCVVADNDYLEIPSEIVEANKVGRFEIDPDWQDEHEVWLNFVQEVAAGDAG